MINFINHEEHEAHEDFFSRLLKKTSEARRTKIDERRRTLLYVDAKSVERNEGYESFSAACYEP